MKIRRPWVIQALCMFSYWFLRALLATVPCKYWRTGRDLRPVAADPNENLIYAMWHEYLLVPMVQFSNARVRLLISQHADGLIVAEICKHLRMGHVRGSSTRGGVEAVRRLLRPSRYRHLAVTPDGPRGPRREVQMGIIYLAAKLGWPIVPVGVGYRKPWRFQSWDRFAIPLPWRRAVVMTAEPLTVPSDLDRTGLEAYRIKLEELLNELTIKAEKAAHSGRRPVTPAVTTEETKKWMAA